MLAKPYYTQNGQNSVLSAIGLIQVACLIEVATKAGFTVIVSYLSFPSFSKALEPKPQIT